MLHEDKLFATVRRFYQDRGSVFDVIGKPEGPMDPLAECYANGLYGREFCSVVCPSEDTLVVDVVPVSGFLSNCLFIPCRENRMFAIQLPRRYRHD